MDYSALSQTSNIVNAKFSGALLGNSLRTIGTQASFNANSNPLSSLIATNKEITATFSPQNKDNKSLYGLTERIAKSISVVEKNTTKQVKDADKAKKENAGKKKPTKDHLLYDDQQALKERKQKHQNALKSQNFLLDYILKGGQGNGSGIYGWLERQVPSEMKTVIDFFKGARAAYKKNKGYEENGERSEKWLSDTKKKLNAYRYKSKKGLLSDVEEDDYRRLQAEYGQNASLHVKKLSQYRDLGDRVAGLNSWATRQENLSELYESDYNRGLLSQFERARQSKAIKQGSKNVKRSIWGAMFGRSVTPNEPRFDYANLMTQKFTGRSTKKRFVNGEWVQEGAQAGGLNNNVTGKLTGTLGLLNKSLRTKKKDDKKEGNSLLSSLLPMLLMRGAGGLMGGVGGGLLSGGIGALLGGGAGKLLKGGLGLLGNIARGPVGWLTLAGTLGYGAGTLLNNELGISDKISKSLNSGKEEELANTADTMNNKDKLPPDVRYKAARSDYFNWENTSKPKDQADRERQWDNTLKAFGFENVTHKEVPVPVQKSWWQRLIKGDDIPIEIQKSQMRTDLNKDRNNAISEHNGEKIAASQIQGNVTINAPTYNNGGGSVGGNDVSPIVTHNRETTYDRVELATQAAWNMP